MPSLSTLPYQFRINGVVSTDKTVLQNLETLCSAAQSWLTYDVNSGLWSVIINQTGNSIASFSDSNIVGSVSVQGTGLRDLYNTVRVEFPHVDLSDEPDFIEVEIPDVDRNANEPDNTLNIQFDCINDPVQAEIIGLTELKQSRVDRVVTFDVDYSYLGLKAGDLIDLTSAMLGYTNKVFRIISITEKDGDEGLLLSITGLEYDANVYDVSDLYRYNRSNQNGIVTIGQIGTPTAPVLTQFLRDARPGLLLDTTVPTGIVDAMEFWLSYDNTTFQLIGTEVAQQGSYTFGQTVSLDYDRVAAGNVYAKCRAINATTSSLYSNTTSLLNWAPVQTTDALTENTTMINSSTGNLLIANGLLSIIGGIDGILSGNTAVGTSGGNIAKTMSSGMITPQVITVTGANANTQMQAASAGYTDNDGYVSANTDANPITFSFSTTAAARVLQITVTTPSCFMNYNFQDRVGNVVVGQISAQPAFAIQVKEGANLVAQNTIDWTSSTVSFNLVNQAAGSYTVAMFLIPTYDLDMNWSRGNLTSDDEKHQIFFTGFSGVGNTTCAVTAIGRNT